MPRLHHIVNLHVLALTLVVFPSVACGGAETWTLVKLLTKEEGTYTVTEVIEVRNCGVPEHKTAGCSAGTWSEFNVSVGTGYVLEASVSSSLGVGRESGQSLALELPPEGSVYWYTVNKEYRAVAGEVLARSSAGAERTATYAFHASCSLRIESRDTLPCPETAEPIPTMQPPPPPILTVPARISPEQAVRDYYALINQHQYETTWSRLSDHFKSIKNCCTADGQYDYLGYVAWWKSVAQVNISSLYLVEETETSARLIVDISYVRFSQQPTYHDPHFQIDLVWDPVSQRWMFYDTKSFRQ